MIGRREFITLLGGAAVSWPVAARAQQAERMRRIAVLSSLAADDPQSQRRMTAFVQGLQQFGWTDGRNVTMKLVGARATANACADTQRNWLRSRRTSFLPSPFRPWCHCNRQPTRCRSCSCKSPTPSVLDSSKVCHDRAAMRPAFP